MEAPTLMTTLSHDNTHAHNIHQCFYLSPFDINGKGYLSLGFLPLTELSLGLLPLSALSFVDSPPFFIPMINFSLPLTRTNSPYQSDILAALTNHG
jgi:hypothetical protein